MNSRTQFLLLNVLSISLPHIFPSAFAITQYPALCTFICITYQDLTWYQMNKKTVDSPSQLRFLIFLPFPDLVSPAAPSRRYTGGAAAGQTWTARRRSNTGGSCCWTMWRRRTRVLTTARRAATPVRQTRGSSMFTLRVSRTKTRQNSYSVSPSLS